MPFLSDAPDKLLIFSIPFDLPPVLTADIRCAPFAIGNRKSKIAIVAVPVVQRTEQGFPNPAGFPSHEANKTS
jgi:hypothetical protein